MSDDQGHAADCQTAKRPGGWLVAFNNNPEGVEALGADCWTAIMATPPFCLIEATRA